MPGHLIAFSGLPGTGKSTVARALAADLGAVWLRVDSAEAAIAGSALAPPDLMDAGYAALYALSQDNLALGHTVITDAVNPINLTREAFANAAIEAGARFTQVEVICSDAAEHRARIEARHVRDARTPDWATVAARAYDPHTDPHLVIDTADDTPAASLAKLHALLA
ncbi:MAG: AAA family ATPase [Pseudomonadota bacterium]